MEELLERWNPWWSEDRVPKIFMGIKREKYLPELLKQAGENRISVVTGPRRAGKTTLLYQVIDSLLTSNIEPKNILYAQLDHPGLDADIGTVVREYKKLKRIHESEKIYLFLDEAQYAKDWAKWAKSIYDTRRAKLFISGSTTALLEKDAYASLTGRWRKNQIWPLDFSEFLEFRELNISGAEQYLESVYLKDYAATGGFPEMVMEMDERMRSRMLVELFDDMVFKDAARTRKLRDVTSLRQVAVFMASSIGSPVSINKMKNTFKLSTETISNYIDALCSAYLFFPCQYYSKSINERTYNPKKYYMIDTGMAAAVLGRINYGAFVENILALHYLKKGDVWYWKSGGEVDFVLGDAEAAMESKYKNDVSANDLKGGLEFVRTHKLDKLYVATEEQKEKLTVDNIDIHLIPSTRILLEMDGPYNFND